MVPAVPRRRERPLEECPRDAAVTVRRRHGHLLDPPVVAGVVDRVDDPHDALTVHRELEQLGLEVLPSDRQRRPFVERGGLAVRPLVERVLHDPYVAWSSCPGTNVRTVMPSGSSGSGGRVSIWIASIHDVWPYP